MKNIVEKNIGLIIIVALFSVGCNVAKQYTAPTEVPANLYRDVNITDTNNIGTLPYTQVFADTILQNLIKTGIGNNLNLKIAYTRIAQAQASYQQSRAAFLPTLSGNIGVTELKLSEVQGFGIRNNATQFQFGLNSSWEADVWGKLSSNRRASLASLLQTEAGARVVQTGLVSNIASLYFNLLALDQQLLITQKTVYNWDTTVTTIKALKEAARVTEAAVVQSEAQRYAAEVTLPDILQRIRETENALSILLGESLAPIRRGSLQTQQIMAELQTGVPAQLLANRPDVQQAELTFRNAFELTNVARAFFYPSFNITSSAGLSALTLGSFFTPGAIAASLGVSLTQPIFNQRLNRTRLAIAEAQQQGALLSFQNVLLTAGQEVSNSLSLYQTAKDKIVVRAKQLNSLQKSVEYSQELLRYGFANYTEVINARQFLLQAELGGVNDQLQQLQATVNLYRALGGGWQ